MTFLILIFSCLFQFANAETPQGCPDCKNFKDPVLEACALKYPDPAGMKIKDSKSKLYVNDCVLCNHNPSKDKKNVELRKLETVQDFINASLEQASIVSNQYKTPAQVRDYMSCYRDTDGSAHYKAHDNFCSFRIAEPYIRYASRVSGLPYAVQACLYFRESNWIPKAVSEVAAQGYIQFMPSTAKGFASDTINAPVSKTLRTGSARSRMVWDELWKNTPNKPTQMWIDDKNIKNNIQPPSCPQVAFMAGASYQVYNAYYLGAKARVGDVVNGETEQSIYKDVKLVNSEQLIQFDGVDPYQSALLLAGSYNMGPAAFATCCSGIKSVNSFLKSKKVPEETRRHVESIRNCAASVNFGDEKIDPLLPLSEKNLWQPMMGWPARDCSQSKCKADVGIIQRKKK